VEEVVVLSSLAELVFVDGN